MMTIEEIFAHLNTHMIEGLMTHAQLSDYYDFLGLKGYAICHNYHFYSEGVNYRKVSNYFLTHYQKLIPEQFIPNPKVIPESWYNYTRQDVDEQVRKAAIQTSLDRWEHWESETKKLYETLYQELISMEEIASACYVRDLILDVSEELKDAQQIKLENKAIDFDIVTIMERQDYLYRKYKRKIKEDIKC